MKILFSTPQARPFSKFGGLGDVSRELAKNLEETQNEVSLVLPDYGGMLENVNSEKVLDKEIRLEEKKEVRVSRVDSQDLSYYLVSCDDLFLRNDSDGGFEDDFSDFAYFSKAVVELLKVMDSKPDVCHCNNWQTALIPAYLDKLSCETESVLENIRTIFTVHSIEPQGKLSEIGLDELDFPDSYSNILENGIVNMMKAGLIYSDSVNTVSKTYAQEIEGHDPEHYHGLEEFIREEVEMEAIPNSLEEDYWGPGVDESLYLQYNDSEGKLENKEKFLENMDIPNKSDSPLIGMVSRLVRRKGVGLVMDILPKLMTRNDFNFVLLGVGEDKYEEFFTHIDEEFESAKFFKRFDDSLARKIFAASDLLLNPSLSEPFGLTPLIGMRYGAVPIVRDTGGLSENFVGYGESGLGGNGFVFSEPTSVGLEGEIDRALRVWEDGEDWKDLVEKIMDTDFSWDDSVRDYERLYHSGG